MRGRYWHITVLVSIWLVALYLLFIVRVVATL